MKYKLFPLVAVSNLSILGFATLAFGNPIVDRAIQEAREAKEKDKSISEVRDGSLTKPAGLQDKGPKGVKFDGYKGPENRGTTPTRPDKPTSEVRGASVTIDHNLDKPSKSGSGADRGRTGGGSDRSGGSEGSRTGRDSGRERAFKR